MLLTSEILLLTTSSIIPILLAVVFSLRVENEWKAVGWGALSAIIVQVVLRVPIVLFLSGQQGFASFAQDNPAAYTLIMSLLYAFFQASIGWLMLRFMFRQPLSLMNALGYGLGFALLEGLLFSGAGTLNALLGSTDTGSLEWLPVLCKAWERLSMLLIEIVYALWLRRSINAHHRKILWFLAVFFLMSLIQFAGSALLSLWVIPELLFQLLLFLAAVLLFWQCARQEHLFSAVKEALLKHDNQE